MHNAGIRVKKYSVNIRAVVERVIFDSINILWDCDFAERCAIRESKSVDYCDILWECDFMKGTAIIEGIAAYFVYSRTFKIDGSEG